MMRSKWSCTMLCLVAQSCPTLCIHMDYIAHPAPLSKGILQERILEWVAMPSSRESSQPRDQTQVSRIADRFFTVWATREAPEWSYALKNGKNKNLPAIRETWVWSLGWEDPLETGKATHSSVLAWRIPWTIQSQSWTWLSDFHFHSIEINVGNKHLM